MRTILRIGLVSLAPLIILGLMPHRARAANINVPADQPTIQAAINAASNGDTVLVAPGTYYENINFMGKAITVTSSGGPSVTTINGSAAGSVVTFSSNEGTNSVLNGFTITNGLGSLNGSGNGGGITIYSASPTVKGNVITNNAGTESVGGIYAMYSSAVIQANVITYNGGTTGGGGVLIAGSGSVQLIGNQISFNVGGLGTGVAVAPGVTPTIENNTINGNTSRSNSGSSQGGGIFIYGYALVVQNLITDNSADQGGGVFMEGSNPTPVLVNNTIANNNSANGSGVYVYENPSPYGQAQFINNLVIAVPGQTALYCDGSDGGQQDGLAPIVQSSDAFSSGGNGFAGNCAGMDGTNGNISADPLFLNGAGNFHLQYGSPTIDVGDNSAPDLPTTDIEGDPRIVNSVVDLGVYEFYPAADSISPTSLSFGSQQTGTSSSAQTVTITNTGSSNLFVGVFADTNFAETNNCEPVVAPGGACTVNVTFTPTAAGTLNGNLYIRSNAAGSPQTVALSGKGFGQAVSLLPSSLNFGSVNVGAVNTLSATLTNTGDATVTVSSVLVSGTYYSLTSNTCGSSLNPGATCALQVRFNPGAPGTLTGTLTVADSSYNSPQTVSLTGVGIGPAVALSPANLAFGNVWVGTDQSQDVLVTNTGTATLNISSISATAGFNVLSQCGTPTAIPPSGGCTIIVGFLPTTPGPQTGELLIHDDAPGSPQIVALSGTGAVPPVTFSSLSLSLGSQPVGTMSAAQAVTLTNTWSGPLTIYGITASADFAQTNNCPLSPSALAVNGTCTINVTFIPSAPGSRTGFLTITDNTADSPQYVSLLGTGLGPALFLSPSSLRFSDPSAGQFGQLVGTTSPAQAVTLRNTGTTPLDISGISASADFGETNNCGTSLAAGATCTIKVTFTPVAGGGVPGANGTRTGALIVTDDAAGSPQTVTLYGFAWAVSLSPANLYFYAQPVGTISAAQTVTLTNFTGTTLTISNLSLSAPFSETNNCGTTVAAGASCAINVTYSPQSDAGFGIGTTLVVYDSAPEGSQYPADYVNVYGTTSGPAPTFSKYALSLGSVAVGAASAPQTVTLTNSGTATLNILGIFTTGDFAPSNNCGPSLAVSSSCTISVVFSPTTRGTLTGTLKLSDNIAGAPQSVSLSGTGTASSAFLSSASLTFGNQPVGTMSAAQALTLTNSGGAPLNISSIASSGDFVQTNNCGTSVAAGASCGLNVTFTPSAIGSRAGALTITDNASGSPQSISLSGTGTAPVAWLPASMSFGNQVVGTTSTAQAFVLENTGNAALNISSIAASGDFAQTNNCGTTLAPVVSCSISVTFTPTATGTRTGTLTVTDNAANSPQIVSLSGSGVSPSAGITIAPVSYNFGSVPKGTSSAAVPFVLHNGTSSPAGMHPVWIGWSYAQTNNCGSSLAAGASCTINATFTPLMIGTINENLVVTLSAPSGSLTLTVPLTGVGATGTTGPLASLSPTSLTFASQPVGSTSASQAVTLTNTGNANLNITAIATSGPFAWPNNCPSSLVPGAHCSISVTFTPSTTGTVTGQLLIADNAPASPQIVGLTGTGGATGPLASLTPTSLTFASQNVGTTSAAQVVTLANTGNSALNISSIAASGDFAQTNNCGTSVAASGNCSVNVTFTPSSAGSRTGAVTITDNAAGSPQSIALSGTGTAPAITLSSTSLSFGPQQVGTTSAAQAVTLSNSGNTPLNISSIAASGDFAQTNNCGTSVAAGGNCSVNVTFTPSTAGSRTGAVTITDNAAGSPQSIALSGTGTAPAITLSSTSLSFGPQQVGTTSAAQAVTLSNSGNAPLNISSIAASGDFAETNNCGSSVAASGSCSINVTFKPTVTGSRTGAVTITDNAAGSPQSIALSGTGTVPVAALSPASLSFSNQVVGTTSAAQSATLSNTGAAPLAISAIATTGDFAQTNNCGTTLAPGANCSISVTFRPTTTGTRSGTLTVTDNASGSPQTAGLSGAGTALPSLSPNPVNFGSWNVGSTSTPPQVVMLSNPQSIALSISGIAITGTNSGDFIQGSNTCGTSLAAAANCTINLTFKPTATGTRAATLTVTDDATNSPQSVSLSGSGASTSSGITIAPASYNFGTVPKGTSSAAVPFVLHNGTSSPAGVYSVWIGWSYAQTNNCGSSLAAGASCTINATFTPLMIGTINENLAVSLSTPSGSLALTVPLTGIGK